MARLLSKLAGALVALALVAGPTLGQERSLTILSVNDTHSNLDASGPKDANLDGTIGGLVKASGVIAAELDAAKPNAVFLHAGDLFMGDSYFFAFHGVPELQVLQQLGLNAMVVGNHELWYPPCLMLGPVQAASGVTFPLLGANVVTGACTVGIAPVIAPSALIRAGDVRVGVVGLTTPFDLIASQNATILGAADPPAASVRLLIDIALPQVRALREQQGADVVVLLTHLPAALDEALASNLPGIDAVVGGHDHREIAETVEGPEPDKKLVPVIHAGAYYRKLGKVVLSVGAGGVSVRSAELVAVDQRVPRPSPAQSPVAALVAGLQAAVPVALPGAFDPADPFHEVIAFAEKNVSNELNMKVPKRDTGTGNLVTDALRTATGTEIAFTVTGQTPQGIAAGPVVQEDLLRMVGVGLDSAPLPRIAKAEVAGGAILIALEKTIGASLEDDDFILQVSGMRYVYDSSRPAGERIVSVEIGGKPLVPEDTYTVTMNALLYSMLPALDVEIVPGSGQVLDDFEFSAIRDYVAGLGAFTYAGENRVRDLAVRGGKP